MICGRVLPERSIAETLTTGNLVGCSAASCVVDQNGNRRELHVGHGRTNPDLHLHELEIGLPSVA